ncbi:hypothetical protein C1I88_11110 [Akkermansia muciniphila]|nr:hypothetical protein C1I88_11110 [Akkermansia muciniphila]
MFGRRRSPGRRRFFMAGGMESRREIVSPDGLSAMPCFRTADSRKAVTFEQGRGQGCITWDG